MKSVSVPLKPLLKITSASDDAAGRYRDIITACERLAEYLGRREGISARARSSRDLFPFFASLPEAQQAQLHYGALASYLTCVEASELDHSLRDRRFGVERHMARHRVRTDESVLKIIDQHDCVEFYDVNFVQTYRNPSFLQFTDHSLEDLAILPYWDIFIRSEDVSYKIIQNARALLDGTHRGPNWNFIERNIVKEVGSGRVSRVHTIVCAPVYGLYSDEILGLIHVFDVEAHSVIQLLH